MSFKRMAEINGRRWEVNWPWCCGCSEFVVSGGCGYEGNGCRFPEKRTKRPISFSAAYGKITRLIGKGWEEYADELGDCIEK